MLKNLLGFGGSRVRGYSIIEQIAEGGFSNVFKARSKSDDRLVALKVLKPEGRKLARRLQKTEGTLWEGELMAQFDHPNIATVYDYGRDDRPQYLAMEYVQSYTPGLIHRCKSDWDVQRKLDVLIQVAQALEYVHEQGYLHRDLCAGNILVSQEGDVRLIDFGLSAHHTVSVLQDWKAGTPSYMAPELVRTSRSTYLTDIYAFGVILYEFVTGVKPVKAEDRYERMMRSLSVPVAPPKEHCAYVPDALDALIMRAIAKEPEERFQTMRDLVHALLSIGIGGGTQVQLLPSGVDSGHVIESDEVSLMAWAHSPLGIELVEFQYSIEKGKWKRIGDRVPARPGRENIFGVDWDASGLPEGAQVQLRAVALDRAEGATASDSITVVVGTIKPSEDR